MKKAFVIGSLLLLFVSSISVPRLDAHPVAGHRHWDEGTYDVLGQGALNFGNQVGMWQAFLTPYTLPCAGLDGYFGPQTASATESIQNFFGLQVDGIVGPQTWRVGSDWIEEIGRNPATFTIYYEPVGAGSPYPQFQYVFGNEWSWLALQGTSPFEYFHHSDHVSGLTFGNTC